MYRFKVAGNLSSLVSLSLNKRREPGGSEGRNPYDAGEGALSRRERSGDAMGEGAPSMSLGSSPATPTRTIHNPACIHFRDPDPKTAKPHFIPHPHLKSSPNNRLWTKLGKRAGFFGDWLWKKMWTAFHPQAR